MKENHRISMKENPRIAETSASRMMRHAPIAALTIIFFITRIIFIARTYKLPIWDEAVYMGMGKYLYSLSSAGLWESIRPLGLPIITGIGWLMGNELLFSEIFAAAMSSVLLILTYKLSLVISNDRRKAFISALLLALCPVFYYNSGLILTDIPSTAFSVLSLIFLIRSLRRVSKTGSDLFLSGLFAGIAAMFRFPQGILIFVIIAVVIYLDMKGGCDRKTHTEDDREDNRKISTAGKRMKDNIKDVAKSAATKVALLAAGFALVTIPFLIFNLLMYSPHVPNMLHAALRPIILGSLHQGNIHYGIGGDTLLSQIYNISFYLITLAENSILLLLWIPAFFVLKGRKYLPLKTLTLFLLAYLTWITNKQDRFILMALPMVSIMASAVIVVAFDAWNKYRENHGENQSRMDDTKKILLHVAVAVIAALFVFTLFASISMDRKYYQWEYKSEPSIVQYYEFIGNNGIKGPILVTDPVFAAYTDEKLIPFYDTINTDYSNADAIYINSWEEDYGINAVAYSDYAFPCTDDVIVQCETFKQRMRRELEKDYLLAYETGYQGYERYIYVKKWNG